MTDKQIIEAMARLDGVDINGYTYLHLTESYDLYRNREAGMDAYVVKYLTSHDAVQPVIDGLDDDELLEFVVELSKLTEMGATSIWSDWNVAPMLKATPRQKCESILKAKGLWK